MVLIPRLARFAFACPRPLIAVAPGATAERLAVERVLRLRGGTAAASAADADTVVVCGALSASLEEVVDGLWQQVPAPRSRVRVLEPADAGSALDRAASELVDVGAQRAAAADHLSDGGVRARMGSQHEGGEGDEDMMMPAGLAMAEQAPDRDGLKLDRLHVRLGPVLPDWPAGLVLDVALQGDVVQEAEVHTVAAAPGAYAPPAFWDAAATAGDREAAGGRVAAGHLDSVARLLGVAGWDEAAMRARRLRDDLLEDRADPAAIARLARRVGRSRSLRWLLAGIGTLDHDEAVAHGVGGPALRADGDVHARLRQWLAEAEAAAAGRPVEGEGPRGPAGDASARGLLAVLPELIRGLDLAAARLVVASLDPDPDQLAGVPAEPVGG